MLLRIVQAHFICDLWRSHSFAPADLSLQFRGCGTRTATDFPSEDVIPLPNLPYNGDKRQDDPFHWGSGPYALLLATTMSKYIKIVGFDLYGTKDGNTNNVYASTDGYKTKKDDAVDWSYWVYQIAKLFEHNKDTTFHFFNLENWKCPKQWNFKNIKVDNINKL